MDATTNGNRPAFPETEPKFTAELACCEMVMLNEIAQPDTKQKSLALTYAMSIASSEAMSIDWKKVNNAIISRWSRSGLERIKKQAWRLIEQKRAALAANPKGAE